MRASVKLIQTPNPSGYARNRIRNAPAGTMNQNATPPGSIAPAHHDLDLSDELLIDAEADDVGVQSARPAAHLLWIALGLVCVAFNLISLIAIATAPETRGIDMDRADPAARRADGAGLVSTSPVG